jgi:hypothetical protein
VTPSRTTVAKARSTGSVPSCHAWAQSRRREDNFSKALIQSVLPQLTFSFYSHQPIRADFSGGQSTSDAGLLPLRAFDQRHHPTREWAEQLNDPRQEDRLRHGHQLTGNHVISVGGPSLPELLAVDFSVGSGTSPPAISYRLSFLRPKHPFPSNEYRS